MKSKGIISLPFLAIIAVIIFGVGIWATYYAKSHKQNEEVVQIPILHEEVATTTDQDLKDWKTYRNKKYSFELKYPESLKLLDNLESKEQEIYRALSFNYKIDNSNNFSMNVTIEPNPEKLTAKEYVDSRIKDGQSCTEVCGWFSLFKSKFEKEINGNDFAGILGAFDGDGNVDLYYVTYGDKIYSFLIPQYPASFGGADSVTLAKVKNGVMQMNGILSTFKFTN